MPYTALGSDVGDSVISTPVPASEIVCGVPGLAFRLVSVKIKEPLIELPAVGVKLIGSVQLA